MRGFSLPRQIILHRATVRLASCAVLLRTFLLASLVFFLGAVIQTCDRERVRVHVRLDAQVDLDHRHDVN